MHYSSSRRSPSTDGRKPRVVDVVFCARFLACTHGLCRTGEGAVNWITWRLIAGGMKERVNIASHPPNKCFTFNHVRLTIIRTWYVFYTTELHDLTSLLMMLSRSAH